MKYFDVLITFFFLIILRSSSSLQSVVFEYKGIKKLKDDTLYNIHDTNPGFVSCPITSDSCRGVTVHNCYLNGLKGGIYVNTQDVCPVTVTQCSFYKCRSYGFAFTNIPKGEGIVSSIQISSCTFEEIKRYNISLSVNKYSMMFNSLTIINPVLSTVGEEHICMDYLQGDVFTGKYWNFTGSNDQSMLFNGGSNLEIDLGFINIVNMKSSFSIDVRSYSYDTTSCSLECFNINNVTIFGNTINIKAVVYIAKAGRLSKFVVTNIKFENISTDNFFIYYPNNDVHVTTINCYSSVERLFGVDESKITIINPIN